jgi:tetratricopeptide (TPR) repeat protein
MIDSGAVRRGKDGKFSGTVTGGFSIPETLQGVITARLDCLAPGYRRILQVSSVVGRNFRKNIVASVLDTPVEDKSLADSIAELRRRDFIYPRAALRADLGPGGDTEFSFKHGITQDVVYGSLLLAQRRTMHQRVGESFERNYPGKTDEFAATLAMHFEKAGEREKALTYTMKAAEIARSTYANQEALLHLLKALSFLEENGEDEPGGRSRAGVYESLGDIYGVIAKYESAISSFDSALSLVTGNHSRAVLLRKKGQVYERWGRYEPADACFRKALDELKEVDDATEEARVRIGLGRVFLRLEKLDDAAGHCEEALSVMDRVNDTSGAAEACNTLGNIYSKKREFEKAVDCYERCRGIWEEAGHLDGLAVIYNNLGQIFHHREKWNEAALHYEKSLDLSEKIGNRYGSARTSDNLSQVYATLGDQKRAMKYLKKAVDIFGEISREGADVIPEMWTQSGSL